VMERLRETRRGVSTFAFPPISTPADHADKTEANPATSGNTRNTAGAWGQIAFPHLPALISHCSYYWHILAVSGACTRASRYPTLRCKRSDALKTQIHRLQSNSISACCPSRTLQYTGACADKRMDGIHSRVAGYGDAVKVVEFVEMLCTCRKLLGCMGGVGMWLR
jgi:hypothetical protein